MSEGKIDGLGLRSEAMAIHDRLHVGALDVDGHTYLAHTPRLHAMGTSSVWPETCSITRAEGDTITWHRQHRTYSSRLSPNGVLTPSSVFPEMASTASWRPCARTRSGFASSRFGTRKRRPLPPAPTRSSPGVWACVSPPA